MVNPYLNRDESIILTTHNVSFNSLVTELILTNQRLIIFDTRHIQFRYQTIPLTTIETVMAREDTQGNPVMYLSVAAMTLDSAPQSKEFTFLPQTSGERRQECDLKNRLHRFDGRKSLQCNHPCLRKPILYLTTQKPP
jgi:stringent starvation protein B